MSDQKNHRFRSALYHSEANRRGRPSDTSKATSSPTTSERRISEQQGGETFRKWLSQANTQPTHRSRLDASIYSWRGYNNWANEVRQMWKVDEPIDS